MILQISDFVLPRPAVPIPQTIKPGYVATLSNTVGAHHVTDPQKTHTFERALEIVGFDTTKIGI